jgi:hypothetical protein
LSPGATDDDLSRIEELLGLRLPTELRAALSLTTGFEAGPLLSFDLLDVEGFGMDDVFPFAYPLAHDGAGNFWVLDLLPDMDACGPVFFACHDPPVVAFQSPDPASFVQAIGSVREGSAKSPVHNVQHDVTMAIWSSRSGLMTHESALASDDQALARFAGDFPSEAVFADLRAPVVGNGFPWGHFGPRTEWRRAGELRLWATVPPAPRPGLIARLFGRSGRS